MFKTIEEIFASPLMGPAISAPDSALTDRVLKSTRLEQRIYDELHGADERLPQLETQGSEKLKGFKA
jgi:hypothetical protein